MIANNVIIVVFMIGLIKRLIIFNEMQLYDLINYSIANLVFMALIIIKIKLMLMNRDCLAFEPTVDSIE